jgi:type VI secretion system Hcp family effector
MAYTAFWTNPKDSSITAIGDQRGKSNKNPDMIQILSLRYKGLTPVDIANGRPTGERVHEPVEFIMENQAATNDLIDRLCTSKKVTPDGKTVQFSLNHQNLDNGKDEVYYTIDLTEVYVQSVELITGMSVDDQSSDLAKEAKERGLLELVRVKLSYRAAMFKHVISPVTQAEDDWSK